MRGYNNQNLGTALRAIYSCISKKLSPQSQLHLVLFLTPLQAVITCQMSIDCAVPVWAKAKGLGKSLGGPNETSNKWV